MTTIVWKELRENARWIPLGALPIIVILVLKWWSPELVFDAQEYGSSLSLSSLVALAASAIAVCLGVLQSWPDQRPAACALLLHRGITANAAFCGKLLAGLLLYAAAVYVPLLGMAAFLAVVGIEHRAASPSALLPAAVMGVCAFSCWPAALLVVQRDARLVGSRLLPGVTAGLAIFSCAALMNDVFWLMIVIAVLALACFLAGARSVFVNSSQVATGGSRAAMVVSVTVALLMANLLFITVVEHFQRRSAASSRAAVTHNYRVEFGPDGKPWLTRAVYSNVSYSNVSYAYEPDQVAPMKTDRSVRDELEPVPDDWKALKKWTTYIMSSDVSLTRHRFLSVSSLQIPAGGSYVNRSWILDINRDVILVYRIGADARYHLETTLVPPVEVGSFGELGPIGHDSKSANTTLVTSTGVFSLPGHGTTVELVYAWPTASKFLGSELASQRDPNAAFGVLARLEHQAVLLEGDSNRSTVIGAQSLGSFAGTGEVFVTKIRLPDELSEAHFVTIARDPTSDSSFVATAQNYATMWSRIGWMRFDADGQINEQADYDNSSDNNAVEPGNGAAAFIPPGTFLIGAVIMAIENERGLELKQAWDNAKENPRNTASFVGYCSLQPLIGIPLALWAARRRRLDKRQVACWLLWAFFYGPFGALAVLAVYPRIEREPCPACRRPTRIDLTSCEHCQHSIDDVVLTGIEIFDRDRKVTVAPADASV